MDHRRIDERSLAFGRLIAAKVERDPSLIGVARANLERWGKGCSPRLESTFAEWQAALDGPVEGVLHLLTATEERAVRLRQSNPFAGVLTEEERSAVIRGFAS